jgi:GMP synthase (glutamine-hydrolysing)
VKVVVLQHISCEPPGVYEDVLRQRGAAIARVEVDEGERLPDQNEFDAIVAMGGPMSINDHETLPWLADEKAFVSAAVRAGTPYWGVCLGAQLLAASLGAPVYRGPQPEVGLLPVDLTHEAGSDPLFASLPHSLVTLQWHSDTFDLPSGAVRLASSPTYPNQAFRYANAYAVQFHLEVSDDMARKWAAVPEYAASLEHVLGPGSSEELVRRVERSSTEMRAHGQTLFERWLDVVVEPARSRRTTSVA